jgi:hypothetical protein
MCKELACYFVNFCAWNLECNDLIRLSSKEKILVQFVPRLHPLLIRRHKSMPRLGSIFNFRVLNLKGHGQSNSQTKLDSPGENVALADYCIDA